MFDTVDISNRQTGLNLTHYNYAIVIGVGGVGSWVALNLGLTGQVGSLILFDDDVVESSNLNRTPFKLSNIGQEKVWAVKELILERRPTNVICKCEKFTNESVNFLNDICQCDPHNRIIFDCRDDVFQDLKTFKCKKWKVGYDGLEITIDGNPDDTVVMGQSNGYTVTPSFLCPAQLLANLVVSESIVSSTWFDQIFEKYGDSIDEYHQFDKIITLDTTKLLYYLHELNSKSQENSDAN